MTLLSSYAAARILACIPELAADVDLRAPAKPQRIAGGETTGAFDETVRVASGLDGCTGVMVSSDILLTAGHCLDELDFDSGVAVYRGPDPTSSTILQGIRWGIHPEFCTDCDGIFNDIGYIELVSGFEPTDGFAVPVASAPEWNQLMRAGTDVTLVGYGRTNNAADESGTRRQVDARIEGLIAAGAEFTAGGDGQGGCSGDSGGPAFATLPDGVRRLVGLTSRGYGCGERGIYTAPYPALCWLRDETSLDLLPPECSACDCIQLEEDGCSCSSEGAGDSRGQLLILGLAVVLRRRRP